MTEDIWRKARPLLVPFVPPYRALTAIRNAAYDRGWKKIYHLPVPVISVGGITVGGAGKTPVTLDIARRMQRSPWQSRPAILLRGYRRRSSGYRLVSDGAKILCDIRASGDEAQIYAAKLRRVPVAVDADRYRGGMQLVERFQPSAILLDDGFQHRRLHRDLDIVLLDACFPSRDQTLLPAGPRREPLSSLKRSHLIVLAGYDPEDELCRRTQEKIGNLFGEERLLGCRTQIRSCRTLRTREKVPIRSLKGKKLIPFCGLAKPQKFADTLVDLEAEIPYLIRFPDHHFYRARDAEKLAMTFNAARADFLITTEKDAVKLEGLFEALPILVLEVGINWVMGKERLEAALKDLLQKG